ncbi:MAG: DNA topoisomerase (ATP-hydrolyzing) subunit A [Eubacteriales bacterium]
MAQLGYDANIIRTDYAEVMQKSYIDYAMSVIVARALPDVRDGLKPVQRRVLYDMHELGIRYDRPFRKCARIVGDTMGKYHPHGDSSIYEALVVLTQDFKKSVPLINGHGNFGNIEGYKAAAMRYTEAKLERLTQEALLEDLDKNVVDFIANFDETEKEPSVLPAKFPHLLVNGAEGIAVGMVTSIPPHNFSEVIDATKAYLKNIDITTKELLKYIKGPDFPTGGIVINEKELEEIYETGMGKIKVRGVVEVEKGKGGKNNLVITQIPYTMVGANIEKFLLDVAALAENKKTLDILDISNQSSKEGIRIVIELRKDADVENFTNLLYNKTRLEDTFSVNMLAISDGRPETMSLKTVIGKNVAFQYEVAKRKYTTLLEKELEKKEIQEGLIRACNVIDLIIEVLRGSKNREMAKLCLTKGETKGIEFRYKESEVMAAQLLFTEKQADAIMAMRLYRLIGLEINALMKENEETIANIYRYEELLDKKDAMTAVLIKELDVLKKAYGRSRRTLLENAQEAVYHERKLEEMEVVFLMDRFGYAKVVDLPTYERNKVAADTENIYQIGCKNTGKVCIFTKEGLLHSIKILDLPFGKFREKGIPIDNVSNFDSAKETIIYVTSQQYMNLSQLVFATKFGMMKLVNGFEFEVSKKMVTSTKLREDDEVIAVLEKGLHHVVVLQSKEGYFLRFSLDEVQEQKKSAQGTKSMKLADDDFIEACYLFESASEGVIHYKEKEIEVGKLKIQEKNGKGTKLRI